jgi:hypothetical protein
MSSDPDYASIVHNEEATAELRIAKALEEAKAEASRIATEAINEALKARDLKNAPLFGNEIRDATQVNYRPALQMERENIVKKSELPTLKRDIPPFLSDEEKMFLPNRRKPYAFCLDVYGETVGIWPGVLLTARTMISALSEDGRISISGQDAIPTTDIVYADNIDYDVEAPTELPWVGDVYGYWEANDQGEVTLFDIRGPEKPDAESISALSQSMQRDTPAGKYCILIGSVSVDKVVKQHVSSDIPWFVTILRGPHGSSSYSGTSDSSGSSDSGGSTSDSGGSTSGSDKSTCIVPASWARTGYTALFTMESPEVVFRDAFKDLQLRKKVSRFLIDPRFTEACVAHTIRAIGYSANKPHPLGISVEHGQLVIEKPLFAGDMIAQVEITGIRRGFYGMRFPLRDAEQFKANEATLNAAYPAKNL